MTELSRRASKQYINSLESRVADLERRLAATSHSRGSPQGSEDMAALGDTVMPSDPHPSGFGNETTDDHELSRVDTHSSVDELADHLEGFTISSSGDLRFFGAASGLNLIGSYSSPGHVVSSSYARTQGLEAAQFGGMTDCPDELRDHLLGLFWRWQNSWQYVVHQGLFLNDLHVTKTSLVCTPLLLNAILALASRYSDRLEVRTEVDDPNTAGMTFYTAAQVMLYYENEAPTASTVQATVLIGLYITAADKESTGWLYAGQASRMAFNLGLHLDCSKHVQQGLITSDDAVIRSVTWWGVYVIDR
jgi:hypothetical protein